MALRIGAALSLTVRFSRFGGQAAAGLRVWRELDGGAEVEIVDDGSSAAAVGPALDNLAQRCDLLLGPYGTSTARAAAPGRDRTTGWCGTTAEPGPISSPPRPAGSSP